VLGPGDDVGQSDDEGFSDTWPLGAVLIDGDSVSNDDGLTLTLGDLDGKDVREQAMGHSALHSECPGSIRR